MRSTTSLARMLLKAAVNELSASSHTSLPSQTRKTIVTSTSATLSNKHQQQHTTATTTGDEDAEYKAKIFKLIAAALVVTAGIRVAPNLIPSTVIHAVKLLDADESLLINAGITRLSTSIAMSETSRATAIEHGGVSKLVNIIASRQQPCNNSSRTDEEIVSRCIVTLNNLLVDGSIQGDQALVHEQKRVAPALAGFLKNTPKNEQTEDAIHAAKGLLRKLQLELQWE